MGEGEGEAIIVLKSFDELCGKNIFFNFLMWEEP